MEKVISELERLKISYYNNPEKKWQIQALHKAIQNIKNYDQSIISGESLKRNVKGIGTKIASYIDEILEKGYIQDLQDNDLKENGYKEFLSIVGVGQAKAMDWISKNIYTISHLKEEIKKNNINITHNIQLGLTYYDDLQKRIPRKEINDFNKIISPILKKIDADLQFEICGSYRRGQKDSGDIDLLITHPLNKNYLGTILQILKEKKIIVEEMTKNCKKKFLGMGIVPRYSTMRRIDIMFIDHKSFPTSLLYFTGNKYFNLYIRKVCMNKKYRLNEYYLLDIENNKKIYFRNEKEIFTFLEIPYLSPNDRNHINKNMNI